MVSKLNNLELVVIASYLAGAGRMRTDTEDIAVKANEIAPGRFTWRKYPQQINIDTVRKRLWDACKPECGSYLIGSEREGWLLTEAGLKFAKQHRERLVTSFEPRQSLNERMWRRTERVRLLTSALYEKFSSGNSALVSARDAEHFFRIDDYVSKESRNDKILRLLNAFGNDRQLGRVVKHAAELIRRSGEYEEHFRQDSRKP